MDMDVDSTIEIVATASATNELGMDADSTVTIHGAAPTVVEIDWEE